MYIAVADLVRYLDAKRLRQLVDDDADGSPDTATIESAITGAQAEIDSALDAVYDVPFTTIPAIVADLTMTLTVHRLHLRRLPVPASVQVETDAARTALAALASGAASIPGVSTAAAKAEFGFSERVHTRDTWADW